MNDITKDSKELGKFAPYEKTFSEQDRKMMFAEALSAIRKKNHLQQKEAAELLGISAPSYNSYEKGKSQPTLEMLVRMAFLFHCSVDMLLQTLCLSSNDTMTVSLPEYLSQLTAYCETYVDTVKVPSDIESELSSQDLIAKLLNFEERIELLETQRELRESEKNGENE